MEDCKIVELFWQRNPEAMEATEQKYGRICRRIATDILRSHEDGEECVDDAYLALWESIPPQKPDCFSAYLFRVVRNMSLNRLRENHSQKRGGGELPLVLEELEGCLAAAGSPEQDYEAKELAGEINRFLHSLSPEERKMFCCRYWLALPAGEIAKRLGCREGRVRTALHRCRKKLQRHLQEEGLI